jgi:ADP-ribose pyrophosphatase YjhB (NUDIX family)
MSDNRRYPQRPVLGVGALIFNRDKILLVERGKEPLKGFWSLPGGVLEIGETLEEGIIREVREETGLEVKPRKVRRMTDNRKDEGHQRRYPRIRIAPRLARPLRIQPARQSGTRPHRAAHRCRAPGPPIWPTPAKPSNICAPPAARKPPAAAPPSASNSAASPT